MNYSFEKYIFEPIDESNEDYRNNKSLEDSLIFESHQNENYINNNEGNYEENNIFRFLQEEKSTGYQTNMKDLYLSMMTFSKIKEEKKEDCPPFYSMEQILKINETNFDPEIKNKLIEKKESIEESQNYTRMELTKKKRNREKDNTQKKTTDLYIVVKKGSKRGRKNEKNNINYIHDKNKSDNIIKKIKDRLFKSVLAFANNILNLKKENELLKLDYDKYINKLKREDDLKLLKMPLKDFLSLDISKKYNKNPNYNKEIIEKIKIKKKNDEENINDYKAIKTKFFILDITFEDYIDLCIFKKSLDDLINDYGYNKDYIDYMRIKNNLNIINEISSEVIQKNDVTYFSFFLFYLYNYKRWFYLKKARQNLPNEKNAGNKNS